MAAFFKREERLKLCAERASRTNGHKCVVLHECGALIWQYAPVKGFGRAPIWVAWPSMAAPERCTLYGTMRAARYGCGDEFDGM